MEVGDRRSDGEEDLAKEAGVLALANYGQGSVEVFGDVDGEPQNRTIIDGKRGDGVGSGMGSDNDGDGVGDGAWRWRVVEREKEEAVGRERRGMTVERGAWEKLGQGQI